MTHLGINYLSDNEDHDIINEPLAVLYVGDRRKYKNFIILLKAYSVSKKLIVSSNLFYLEVTLLKSELKLIRDYGLELNR